MSDDDNLHFNATGATGAAGGTTDDAQHSDDDVAVVYRTSSTARPTGVTYGQLSDASGVSVARLTRMGEDELLALADATLADDGGDEAADETVSIDDLDEETREAVVGKITEAIGAGVDISGLLEELADMGLDMDSLKDAVTDRVDEGAASAGTNSAGLTANAQILAAQHGISPEWEHLRGVEVPDELIGQSLTDEAVAAVVNKLHGDEDPGERRVTARSVASARNRSGGATADRETGVSLDAMANAAETDPADEAPDYEDMVGLDPAETAEGRMNAQQARKAVERAQARRGDATTERTGTSLDDLDDAGGA